MVPPVVLDTGVMMTRSVRLTDLAGKLAKLSAKAYRLSDAAGLCLIVQLGGSKLWRYRYRLGAKQAEFAIGVYPEISLARARELLGDARRLVSHGASRGNGPWLT